MSCEMARWHLEYGQGADIEGAERREREIGKPKLGLPNR
jgi:hypothetical protein